MSTEQKTVKNTRKKVKVIGQQTYINAQTNEFMTMNVVSVEDRDANFHKLWLDHLMFTLDIIGNQKTKFVFWLLDQMNRDNLIVMTQRQMATRSGVSLDTVVKTVGVLLKNNFLVRVNIGAYAVNPDIIFRGGKNERLNMLIRYDLIKDRGENDG